MLHLIGQMKVAVKKKIGFKAYLFELEKKYVIINLL